MTIVPSAKKIAKHHKAQKPNAKTSLQKKRVTDLPHFFFSSFSQIPRNAGEMKR
jgi:hypothetical protein